MNYEKWVEVLTNYYEEDLNNCTMSNEVWINQIATAITTPDLFKNDVIEYRKVEGRDLNCKELINNISVEKDLSLITSIIIDEDILGGTIFQTFDKAYEIAEKFQYIYAHDFDWEYQDIDFDEAIIKFTKSELKKDERIKEKEYYIKRGNTSGTID